MNILVIHGSPRKKGSSSTIAHAFAAQAEALGGYATHYHLNAMDFKGCQGCMACKFSQEACAVSDDLTPALKAHQQADVVVWASPIYYFDVTGQFKCYLDRTFSFLKPDFQSNPDACRLPGGKKGLLILTQGGPYHSYYDTQARYELFMDTYGITDRQTIRVADINMPTPEKIQPHLERAQAYARELMA